MTLQTQKKESFPSKNIWTKEFIQACREKTGVAFSEAPNLSKDFGGLISEKAIAVAYPLTSVEVENLLCFANHNNLTLAVRGGGLSQGGQTVAPLGTLTLDCSKMTQVEAPDLEALTITCQGGATWRAVLAATAPHQLVPQVIPFFPDLTVGGVISIGGIGGNSHKHGCVSGNVDQLEVVTGFGAREECSATTNPSLFEATLCGLGRCGVITSVVLPLRKYKPHVKTFYLRYANHGEWLADLKKLSEGDGCDYVDAFCSPLTMGLHPDADVWKPLTCWVYSIQASFEYETEEPTEQVLKSLSYQELMATGVSKTLSFLSRYGARAEGMKQSGNWTLHHPWWECVLPLNVLSEHLPQLLKKLPLILGDGLGYRVFALNENTPVSFMRTSSDFSIGFAVLPAGVHPDNLPQVLDALAEVDAWIKSLGGKRYLSGWLGKMTPKAWQNHYGSYYKRWTELKEQYDPNGVVQSMLLRDTIPKEFQEFGQATKGEPDERILIRD